MLSVLKKKKKSKRIENKTERKKEEKIKGKKSSLCFYWFHFFSTTAYPITLLDIVSLCAIYFVLIFVCTFGCVWKCVFLCRIIFHSFNAFQWTYTVVTLAPRSIPALSWALIFSQIYVYSIMILTTYKRKYSNITWTQELHKARQGKARWGKYRSAHTLP